MKEKAFNTIVELLIGGVFCFLLGYFVASGI